MDKSRLSTEISLVDPNTRRQLLKHPGMTLWFTGLSGAGKTTTAFTLEKKLIENGYMAYVLDGDNVRHGLNQDLGFSEVDRKENLRRIGEVAKLFADCGVIVLVSFISPYQKDRDAVRTLHTTANITFLEIFTDTSLEVCELRDAKGLYQLARSGQLEKFTGVNDPYEVPRAPDISITPGNMTPKECADFIFQHLREKALLC